MWVLIPIFYGLLAGGIVSWTFLPWTDASATHCYPSGNCYH